MVRDGEFPFSHQGISVSYYRFHETCLLRCSEKGFTNECCVSIELVNK